MERETILEKIKKLKAMQESAAEMGNEHEAAAFAAKVQHLLLQHKLEMSEVDNFDITDEIEVEREGYDWDNTGIPYSSKRSHWLSYLANYVAKYNGCEALGVRSSNRVIIVGTEDSRQIVTFILSVLARFGKNSCDKAYSKEYYKAKNQGTEYTMKGFKRAFLSSYVHTIGKRLKEANKEQLAEVTDRGLVVLNAEEQAVKDYIASMNVKNGGGFARSSNRAGAEAGAQAGEEANIGYNALSSDGGRVQNLH